MTPEKIFHQGEESIKVMVYDIIEQGKPVTNISEARVKKTKYFIGRI